MIERLWALLARFANGWVFLALVIAFGLCRIGFKRFNAAYAPAKSFDGRGFYKPSDAPDILKKFGSNIDIYLRQESTLDLAFPIIYSLTFAVGIVWLGKSAPHSLVVLPFATAIFDYCENVSVIGMIVHYRKSQTVPPALAWIASVATPVKTALFLASGVVLIVLALLRLYRYSTAVPSSTL
ncbi:MAG TPA: hypothetical protein VGR02_05515 [Thermoanaerobaculia bacterium]|jgi:hypothetical protein|nr:hypothetical protein [Thermoanaerobaculia bacterium]